MQSTTSATATPATHSQQSQSQSQSHRNQNHNVFHSFSSNSRHSHARPPTQPPTHAPTHAHPTHPPNSANSASAGESQSLAQAVSAPSALRDPPPPPPSATSSTSAPSAASASATSFPSFITQAERQLILKQRQKALGKKPSLTSLLRRGSTAAAAAVAGATTGGASAQHTRRNPFSYHNRRKSTSSLASQNGPVPGEGPPGSTGPEAGDGHRLRRSASLRKLFTDDDHTGTATASTGPPPLPADWASVTASASAQRIPPNPSVIPVLATPLDAASPRSPRSPSLSSFSSFHTTATQGPVANPIPAPAPLLDTLDTNMLGSALIAPPPTGLGIMSSNLNPSQLGTPNEGNALHQHIHDMVNKRISTMDYLRKAHDGRVYWFNTLRFDRPDLARMAYFDARRLARRATNYMMLGLSLPAVVDLNSASATELLRSLAALMTEFEQFQQLHSDSNYGSGGGASASSLSRAARLPNMFRRATPGAKSRRTSSSAAVGANDIGVPALPTASSFDGLPGSSGSGSVSGPSSIYPPSSSHGDRGLASSSGTGGSGNTSAISGPGDSFGGSPLTLVTSESQNSLSGAGAGAGAGLSSSFSSVQGSLPLPHSFPPSQQLQQIQPTPLGAASTGAASTAFATYYDNNTDLLPGEEYTFLLTPSLPFDPDFYETFATLCDVLIDCYQRILSLLPSPRDCSPVIMEQFSKADSRVRKLLVQGVVKEFEEHSRSGVKMEVANVGKIVLGGLM
ncbi:hypothetical protein F503_01088 [Ophiostoma piceae UAMH 11346]|uniref:Uncharacterized protein n=1 Tax=Ophiostoma piceae (strain UAMH 11346) TaxID=1262450 RepID=S3D4J5_OPHP1|nr:hypothetical protein F503_01088 [Ophiostoma piceae UAMH 11346]